MKKDYLLGTLALASMLLTTACQEQDMVDASMANTDVVTFTVNTKLLGTRANPTGEGIYATNLYYGVYEKNADGNYTLVPAISATTEERTDDKDPQTITGYSTDVQIRLVKQKPYRIVFWAEDIDNRMCKIDWTEKNLTVNSTLSANQESYDAFWAFDDITIEGATEKNVTLARPFAQLNIGVSNDDWKAAVDAGIEIENSQVIVKKVPTTMNIIDGSVQEGENTVTYNASALPKAYDDNAFDFPVEGYKYLALNYVLVGNDQSLIDVELAYQDKDVSESYSTSFSSVPVRRNYRTNIYGDLLTGNSDYQIEINPGFGNDGEEDAANIVYASTQAEFEKALKRNDENIVINLMHTQQKAATRAAENPNEFKIYVGAWTEKYYFGGEDTESITINANGCTINFVHENGDWNYIRCVNEDAKWIINDAHLTNSGKNDGPWNRHDIRFYNAVELNNVTSDKAIALLNDGKLTDVEISEEGDVYGLWITAEGQTVELDQCTFNVAGRGIAIKDEYVDEDEQVRVNLTVKNTKFNTEKKAAILVTSKAGAGIKLSNLDLSDVKADQFNAVWIDEDYKDYASNVSVEGGFKVVEGESATSENNPFLKENGTVEIPAGTYKFPAQVAAGITINCAEGTVFEGSSNLNINGAKVVGATFSNPEGNAVGGTINGTFEDCKFTGSNALRYCNAGETVVFENCVFDGSVYGVHFDNGANDVTFRNCTFSGFNAFGAALTQLTIEDCVFKANGKSGYNGANLWGETNIIRTKFIFDGAASTEWIGLNAAKSGKAITLTDCVLEGTEKSMFTYFANYDSGNKVTIDDVEYVLVKDADGLKKALDSEAKNIYLTEGTTFEGTFEIDKNQNLFSDDINPATIKGRVWIKSANPTFKNVTFDRNETDSNSGNTTASNALQYKAVVMIYGNQTNTIKFEECKFLNNGGTHKSAITNVACELIVDKCYFEGYSSGIYSQANLSITNSTFNYTGGNNVIASINGCGDNGGKFIFKGNTITNKIFALSQFLSTVGFGNGTYHFDVQGNTGKGFDYYFLNEGRVANKTFAEGSVTF